MAGRDLPHRTVLWRVMTEARPSEPCGNGRRRTCCGENEPCYAEPKANIRYTNATRMITPAPLHARVPVETGRAGRSNEAINGTENGSR
jgi:hypothetical protein